MLEGKRVFVLGSGSFSGSHFVDHCLDMGAEVRGINRSAETSTLFLPYLKNKRKANFTFFQCHLVRDTERILNLIQEFEPQYVVDFAAQSMVAPSWKDPVLWFETNVIAKVKLHERLRLMKSIEAYLRFTTPEVYGSTSGVVDETAPYNPTTPYAVSQAACDMSVMSFHKQYGFPAILTRASNVYGVGQQLYRIVPKAILCARSGRRLTMDGGGVSVRDFVEIGDVSRALSALLVNTQTRGQTYHITSGEMLSIRDLVSHIAQLTNKDFNHFVQVGEERPGKDLAYELSSTKIRKATGWTPRVPLINGLSKMVEWIDANWALLENLNWDYQHKD